MYICLYDIYEENQRREKARRHNIAVSLRKDLIDFMDQYLHHEYENYADYEVDNDTTICIDVFDADILDAIINALPTE